MRLGDPIFHALNNLAGRSVLADKIFIFLAQYLPYLTVLVAVILFFKWQKSKAHKVQLLFIFGLGLAVSYFLIYQGFHEWWPRLRPFNVMQNVHQLISEYGLSFPSQHAMMFFFLATIICWIRPKIGYWFIGAAVLISTARVIAGVHYPGDILAGAALGAVMGILTMFVARLFRLGKV